MEIAGVGVGEIVKVGAEAGGLVKSIADAFKAVREGAAVGKSKGSAEVAAAIAQGEEKLAKLNDRVLQLQALCAAAQDRGRDLEKELAGTKVEKDAIEKTLRTFETFDKASVSFVEVTLANHSVAMRQSAPFEGKISAAYFCPNCFAKRNRSVLSFKEHMPHSDKLQCSECGTEAYITRDDGPAVVMVQRRSIFDGY